MSFPIIDTIRVMLESSILGSSYLFGLVIIAVLMILFFMTRMDFKIVLVLMLPAILQLGFVGLIPLWVAGMIVLAVGLIWGLTLYNAQNSV